MLLSEFLGYSQTAWDLVEQSDKRSPLRYGQALQNVLPTDVKDKLVWGETDFYYWENSRFVEINHICYYLCEDWPEGITL